MQRVRAGRRGNWPINRCGVNDRCVATIVKRVAHGRYRLRRTRGGCRSKVEGGNNLPAIGRGVDGYICKSGRCTHEQREGETGISFQDVTPCPFLRARAGVVLDLDCWSQWGTPITSQEIAWLSLYRSYEPAILRIFLWGESKLRLSHCQQYFEFAHRLR